MKINNKKGVVPVAWIAVINVPSTALITSVFKLTFIAVAAAAVWHIPAWDQAKANHTEKAYQQQEMWPQQWFDQLPGGTPGRLNVVS